MVIKKKKMTKKTKNTAKKPVSKKAVKKVAKQSKAKKSVKKSTKKPIKKVAKKTTTKSVNKKSKTNKMVAIKKVVKKTSKPTIALAPKTSHKINKIQTSVPRPMMRQQGSSMTMEDTVVVQAVPRKKATTLLGALEFTPYQPKTDEDYMNDHQRDHFRKILDAWKQQLMQDVDLTVGHLKEEAVFYADPVDRASQEEGFNLELRTRDRERKLIKKIEQSLDLLNTSEYGFCEDCGAEIGIRRLEARPTAVKCIDCKTFQEIREKQLGG